MIELAQLAWTIGTALVSVVGSIWASNKVLEQRLTRLEREHEELEKEVLARLRAIEVGQAEIKIMLTQQKHWSHEREV